MRFPPPYALARLGEAVSDMRNADTIAEWQEYAAHWEQQAKGWKQYARGLEQDINRIKETVEQYAPNLQQSIDHLNAEYDLLMDYARTLKDLYARVLVEGDKYETEFLREFPMPLPGFVTHLGARVTGVSFFESVPDQISPMDQWKFKTAVFRQSTARSVIMVSFLGFISPPEHEPDSSVRVDWYDISRNALIYTEETKIFPLPTVNSFIVVNGCYCKPNTQWDLGKYRVRVFFDDEFGAQGEFEIVA